MSDFRKAIPYLLKHEGLFSDNPADPGGPTMYGISLRFLKLLPGGDLNNDGVVDIADVKGMALPEAVSIYFDNFWAKYKYEKIVCQPVATKIFDLCVNMGPTSAHKIVQQALNRLLIDTDKLVVDGMLGPKSFAGINSVKPFALMNAICVHAEKYYESLVLRRPKLAPFLKGWTNRANARCGL